MDKLKIYKVLAAVDKRILGIILSFVKLFKRQPSPPNYKDVRRIMLVSLDYIGDYCMRTVPIIWLARRLFPNAELSIMVGSWTKELVRTNPEIKSFEVYNPGWLDRSTRKWRFFKKFLTLAGFVKNQYDLIIHVRGSKSVGIWYLFNSAKYFLSVDDMINLAKVSLSRPEISWDSLFFYAEKEKGAYFQIPSDLLRDVKGLLLAEGIDLSKSIISIHPCANSKVKQWLPERWAAIIDTLNSRYKCEVLICGDLSSYEYIQNILGHLRSKAYSLSGKTTLLQLAGLIKMSALCIAIDSGPMHLAGILDVPVVGLFGPNIPEECRPLTLKYISVSKRLACLPECIENMMNCSAECMFEISHDDVLRAIEAVWLSSGANKLNV